MHPSLQLCADVGAALDYVALREVVHDGGHRQWGALHAAQRDVVVHSRQDEPLVRLGGEGVVAVPPVLHLAEARAHDALHAPRRAAQLLLAVAAAQGECDGPLQHVEEVGVLHPADDALAPACAETRRCRQRELVIYIKDCLIIIDSRNIRITEYESVVLIVYDTLCSILCYQLYKSNTKRIIFGLFTSENLFFLPTRACARTWGGTCGSAPGC